MLTAIRARLAYHLQAALSCFNVLVNNPVATSMTVLVLGVTLTLPMLFWVLANNVQRAAVDWQRGGHIALYLAPGLAAVDESSLLARVLATKGVQAATLKPADEALIELQGQEGMKEIMQYLPSNPLPAVIDVIPIQSLGGAEELNNLYHRVKSYPHVEQAKFDMQWVSRLYTLFSVAGRAALGLVVVLGIAVVLIIGNTLRMAMHHRQEEIKVLTIIGANQAYIRRPFLYLGLFYGVTGAVVAMVVVWIITVYVSLLIEPLAQVYDMHYDLMGLSIRQGLLLVLIAALLGWLGARLSVHSLCKRQV